MKIKKHSKIIAWVLTFALLLGIMPSDTLFIPKVNAVSSWDVSTTGNITASNGDVITLSGTLAGGNPTLTVPANATVTINGTITGANTDGLRLEIGANATVRWNASLTVSEYVAVRILGGSEGEFIMESGLISCTNGTGIFCNFNNCTTDITINGGTVKSEATSGGYAAIEQSLNDCNGTITVKNGGKVEATNGGYAINGKGDVLIDGGIVKSKNNNAIYTRLHDVTVNSGTVEVTGTGNAISIDVTDKAGGNVTVNSSTVSADAGNAIRIINGTTGLDYFPKLTINSGTVEATGTGNAIYVQQVTVNIKGGKVLATTGYAIYDSYYSGIKVEDALVFAYGSAVVGGPLTSADHVVYKGSGGTFTATNVPPYGVVIAWNKTAGNTVYTDGSTEDIKLLSSSGVTAYWSKDSGGNPGIYYERVTNIGFIPLPVTIDTAVNLGSQTVPITAPVSGVAPQLKVADGTGYIGTGISWNGNPATFAPSTVYTATVTLTSTAGYKWPVTPPTITVNGGTVSNMVVSGGDTAGNVLTFTVTFPATADAPGAPTNLTATPDDRKVTLEWAAPESVGVGGITGYEYTYTFTTGGVVITSPWTSTGSTDATFTVTGLYNGTAYTFQVRAVNAAGISVASNTATATPRTVPYAPPNLSAAAGDGQVTLSWNTPTNGGSPIIDYEYSTDNGSTWISTGGTSTTFTVTGLTNGITYSFWVRAVNAAGAGTASSKADATLTPTYNTGDIAAINNIIANNGLSWTPAPANGSFVPDDWNVIWEPGTENRRVDILLLSNSSISGILDVSDLTELSNLDCNNTGITELTGLSQLSKLAYLYCYGTNIAELNLSGLANLKTLSCSDTNITELNLTGLSSLESLSCENIRITKLDLTGLSKLTSLICDKTDISGKLDLSGFANLKHLSCSDTDITELVGLTSLTGLKTLDCSGTNITELFLDGLTALESLVCTGLPLYSLNLDSLNSLKPGKVYAGGGYYTVSSRTVHLNGLNGFDVSRVVTDASGNPKFTNGVYDESADTLTIIDIEKPVTYLYHTGCLFINDKTNDDTVEFGIKSNHVHTWEAWQSNSSGHWRVCSSCGETTNTASHTYGGWITDTTATYTKGGTRHRNCSVCNYRQNGTTSPLTDNTAPTGEITIKSKGGFTSFLEKITFGLFFKNTAEVTITSADAHSGVKTVEYIKSETSYDTQSEVKALTGWTAYTGKFNITSNWKGCIYVRITDVVGNVTVICSNGVVVYEDSSAATPVEIDHTKLSGDESVEVTLNGNTVADIKNGTTVLTPTTHYTISGNTITFKASYLDSLAASTTPYTLTISYNPMGETFVSGDGNEAPATTTVSLTVNKANQPAPKAPSFESKTETSITLNEIEGAEYRIGNGTWKSSTEFTGLQPNSTYVFYSRMKSTDTYNTSPVSSATVIVTVKDAEGLHISSVNVTENGGWLEITNSTENTRSTRGLFLSNNDDVYKWQMPCVIIRPGVTVRVRANSNSTDEVLKRLLTNFDMEVGETIRLTEPFDNTISEVEISE